MDVVTEWTPVVVGVLVFVVATIGMALALRSESGRDALAAGAVKLALAMLGLAERWLGGQLEPAGTLARGVQGEGELQAARRALRGWLARR